MSVANRRGCPGEELPPNRYPSLDSSVCASIAPRRRLQRGEIVYERLLGREPAFVPHATEAVSELAEDRYLFVVQDREAPAGRSSRSSSMTWTRWRRRSLRAESNRTSASRTRTECARRSIATRTVTRSFRRRPPRKSGSGGGWPPTQRGRAAHGARKTGVRRRTQNLKAP
jgi:hypothetical protein